MSEYNAHQSLKSSKEQAIRDAHAARERAKILDNRLRKERLQREFWRKVRWTVIALTTIIIYGAWKTL